MDLLDYYPLASHLLQEDLRYAETKQLIDMRELNFKISGHGDAYYNIYSSLKLFVVFREFELRLKNFLLHSKHKPSVIQDLSRRRILKWYYEGEMIETRIIRKNVH